MDKLFHQERLCDSDEQIENNNSIKDNCTIGKTITTSDSVETMMNSCKDTHTIFHTISSSVTRFFALTVFLQPATGQATCLCFLR